MTNLPQGWEWKSLGEICESISAGRDKPKNYTEKKSINNQIPIYANGVNNNGLIGYTDKAVIIKPSLTISARGTIGFVCIRKEPYYPIVRLICAIPNEKILYLEYLYFCLNFFIAKGDGSSIPQLTIPKFKILQIPLPSLKEQERIVGILDFAFSKIDENIKKAKENLANIDELMQSALQKAFNPLNDNTKENYQLPQGWEWKSLGDIFNIERGGSPRPIKEFLTDKEDGINWIKIGDIKNQKYLYTTEEKIIQEGLKKSKLVIEGDLLISNSMSFGKPIIVKLQKGAIHDGWLLLREKINLSKEYFYYLFSSNFMYNFLSHQASGSTVKNLNIDKFKQIQIPLPPLKEQEKIAKHLDSVFEKAKALKELYTKELKDYEELKQSLLDKAFKGEL